VNPQANGQYQDGNNFYFTYMKPQEQASDGIWALQQPRGHPHPSFDQTYEQQGDAIGLKTFFGSNGLRFRSARCSDTIDLTLEDGGRLIRATYRCFNKPLEEELVFVPYAW
jgi:hypothetical protein